MDRVLIHCHAGCDSSDVLRKIGLSWRDLFGGPRRARRRTVVAIYPYRTREGVLIGEKLRYEPKGFSWRTPDPTAKDGYRHSLEANIRLPLYRPPTAIESSEIVIIVEGEKAVERLRGVGFVATCGPNGANSWPERFSEILWDSGVTVAVVIPDADTAGERHGERVAASIAAFEPKSEERSAMTVRIVNLPLPPGGDVVDWLDAGGSADELREKIASTPLWFPGQKDRLRLARRRQLNAERQRRFRARKRAERLAVSA